MMELTCTLRDQASLSGLTSFCQSFVTPQTIMVEIGCFAGESTAVFARHAGLVYAVDPWEDRYREAIKAGCADPSIIAYLEQAPVPPMREIEAHFDARTAGLPNIRKLRLHSDAALGLFVDRSLDLVYIDALHTYEEVRTQISSWATKVRTGGVLAGHDYDAAIWPEVVQAVNDSIGLPNKVFADSSWAICC